MSYIQDTLVDIYTGDETIFLWDKKTFQKLPERFCDLRDIFMFYHIPNLEELGKFTKCDKELLESFRETISRVKKINQTFSNFERVSAKETIPRFILEDLIDLRKEIANHGLSWFSEKAFYPELSRFFLDNSWINISHKLKYKILTSHGPKLVNLGYASNFRFHALKNSLDLLHMPKAERHMIIPQRENHKIYSLDFSQFEFRTFLNIHPKFEIPDVSDLYAHFAKELGLDPQTAKVQIIAYIYGQNNKLLESYFKKNEILTSEECTFVGRYPVVIPPNDPPHKKLHTIVQTISQYQMLIKLEKLLEALAAVSDDAIFLYPLHDELIFSINEEKLKDLTDLIKSIMVDDVYKVKEYVGNDFGNMERI